MPRPIAQLRPDRPLSLVLGAGGVRGLAHVGALEAVVERGYRVSEIVGTSVGALIAAFYASVGMEIEELRSIGLGMTTRHLLAWAWLRRAPTSVLRRFRHRAGEIPDSLDRLAAASWENLYHGVERLGLVAYDRERNEVVVGHTAQSLLSVEDAARGAAALPFLFPARVCRAGDRVLRLCDGGVANRLPVNVLFELPFEPEQVLVVDVANTRATRERHIGLIYAARTAHPNVPIAVATPDTIGKPTILYRSTNAAALVADGYRTAMSALDGARTQSATEVCSASDADAPSRVEM
jgi:NTE family protein